MLIALHHQGLLGLFDPLQKPDCKRDEVLDEVLGENHEDDSRENMFSASDSNHAEQTVTNPNLKESLEVPPNWDHVHDLMPEDQSIAIFSRGKHASSGAPLEDSMNRLHKKALAVPEEEWIFGNKEPFRL